MAPSVLETQPTAPHELSNPAQKLVDRKIFPDGIKTSGQHPPLYHQLKPYSAFPKEITGETVWKAEDYTNNPERWVHVFDAEEIAELSAVADKFIAEKIPLTGISKVSVTTCLTSPITHVLQDTFPLPKLSVLLASIRSEILNGKGFILFKGFPVNEWGNHKSAVAYMGLGTYLGYFVSQNGRGHVLGHVKDLGEDATQIDKVRIYRTNAR
jgi:hypothetical protein